MLTDHPMRSSKKWNLNNEQNVGTVVDRLSTLPDDVLTHMLSMLPTKDAVKTCVLATKWKYLWTSINKFDFDDSLLCSAKKRSQKLFGGPSFSAFVDRVLILRDASNIEKFRLALTVPVYACRINFWITTAVKYQVQELDISLPLEGYCMLPCCIFLCESLAVLRLKAECALKVPTNICLPKLKNLCLSRVTFLDGFSTELLLSSCPVLEELSLLDCDWKNIESITISSSTLKKLTISHYRSCTLMDQYRNSKIKIRTRNLKDLNFSSNLTVNFHLSGLYALDNASIDVMNRRWVRRVVGDHVIKLLAGICQVESLTVSTDTLHSLACAGNLNDLPTFSKLTQLEINMDFADYVGGTLAAILQKAPKLQSIYFAEGIETDIDLDQNCLILQPVPRCFTSSLKTFRIGSFNGTPMEMQVLKFVLENATVLERMRIHCSPSFLKNLNMQEEVSKQLFMLPRSSVTCLVELL